MDRTRFNPDLLDAEDPFEFDMDNLPHLHKHVIRDNRGVSVSVGAADLVDAYIYGDPSFYPAATEGTADWLMVGTVPGAILCAPLAPARSGNVTQCRPIGLYTPSESLAQRYQRGD
jgi:hypothetical protein